MPGEGWACAGVKVSGMCIHYCTLKVSSSPFLAHRITREGEGQIFIVCVVSLSMIVNVGCGVCLLWNGRNLGKTEHS